jgi:D-glycero-alpha-D-manno-heptose-7-phosphate kinase
MIISKAPLRLSFGGGGTDLPSHFKKYGGEWYSLAIDKYIYTSINERFYDKSLIRYSQFEIIDALSETNNPLLKKIFSRYVLPSNIEFTTGADIPSGTGLGSSGAFSVSALMTVRAALNLSSTPNELAEEATEIEMKLSNSNAGLQDQYISAFGGLRKFTADTNGHVLSSSIPLTSYTDAFFNDHILLIFTNTSRASSCILGEVAERIDSSVNVSGLSVDMPPADSYSKALLAHDHELLGQLLHTYWCIKRSYTKSMTDANIDYMYDKLLSEGMTGGKLVGAGGGGFIMAVAKDIGAIRSLCEKNNWRYTQVKPAYEGVKLVERTEIHWR